MLILHANFAAFCVKRNLFNFIYTNFEGRKYENAAAHCRVNRGSRRHRWSTRQHATLFHFYVDLYIGMGFMQICFMIIMLDVSSSRYGLRRWTMPCWQHCFYFRLGSEFYSVEITNAARLRTSIKSFHSACDLSVADVHAPRRVPYGSWLFCSITRWWDMEIWAWLASISWHTSHSCRLQTLSFANAQHTIHLTCCYIPSAAAGPRHNCFFLYIFQWSFFHFQCNFLFMRSQTSPACHVSKCRAPTYAAAYVVPLFGRAGWLRCIFF